MEALPLFYLFNDEPKCIQKVRNGTGEGEAGQNEGRSRTDEVVWVCWKNGARQCGSSPGSATAGPDRATEGVSV